jgi:hypothetical protein
MPKTKVTLLINVGTADSTGTTARVGGFSESYYSNKAVDAPDMETDARNLAIIRAKLLPQGAKIIGQRIQQVDPAGPSIPLGVITPGASGLVTDLPQMALLFRMRSSEGFNQRLVTLRGLPDSLVIAGEYRAQAAYTQAIRDYFNEISNFWLMKGRVRTNEQIKVSSVTAGGLVTTQGAHGMTEGDNVIFLRTRNADNELVKGVFFVETAPTDNTFVIGNWANEGFGIITKGKVRLHEEDYFSLRIRDDELTSPRAITREVGRPFGQFSGRHVTAK